MSAAAGSPVGIATELPEGTSKSVPGRAASAGAAGVESASGNAAAQRMPDENAPKVEIPDPNEGSWVQSTFDALNETRKKDSHPAWGTFAGKHRPPLLFYGASDKVPKIPPDLWGDARDWFILGDIHGDYFALRNVVAHVRRLCPNFRLIFLGDLVDRGPHPMECLWFLINLAREFPQRVLWLAGNHDIGVVHDDIADCFRSTVSPSEFLDEINRLDSWFPFRRHFGQEFIELVDGLPRAAVTPDGLLITHGGFPLVDVQAELKGGETEYEVRAWLNSPRALQDFSWTRITRYQARMPNRLSLGCSYGYGDFAAFCKAVAGYFALERLVTGHEHPDGGYDVHEQWSVNRALTLTGFGFAQDYYNRECVGAGCLDTGYYKPEAFGARYQDELVVGRCRPDDIPEVILIPVDRADLEAYFKAELQPRFAAA